MTSEAAQIARAYGLSNLMDAAKRGVIASNTLAERFNELNGAPTMNPSTAVQEAAAECYGTAVGKGISAE